MNGEELNNVKGSRGLPDPRLYHGPNPMAPLPMAAADFGHGKYNESGQFISVPTRYHGLIVPSHNSRGFPIQRPSLNHVPAPMHGVYQQATLQTPNQYSNTDALLWRYRLPAKVYQSHVVHESMGLDGSMICERWEQEKERIGVGAFGSVFLQRKHKLWGAPEVRAVKKLCKDDWEKLGVNVVRELTHLISVIGWPDLFVKFLGWYENDDFVFYAMEYLQYGDLDRYMKAHRLQTKNGAREISRQVLRGLAVLHNKGICHRDLKPQNILVASVSPFHVKLADFGISKCEVGSVMATSGVGTTGYIAPEVLRFLPAGAPRERQYGNAVDMWAFGCLVHMILTSELPFSLNGSFDMSTFARFCGGDTALVDTTLITRRESDAAIDFVKQFLVLDARERTPADKALKHVWLYSLEEYGGFFQPEELAGADLRPSV